MRHMSPFFGIVSGLFCLVLGLAVAAAITYIAMALIKKRRRAFAEGGPGPSKPWGKGFCGPQGAWGHGHHHHPGPRPPFEALHILDERFARSELDVDDYLARRSALLGDRANGTEYTPGDFEHPVPEPPAPERPAPPAEESSPVSPTPEPPQPEDWPGQTSDRPEE